MQEEIRQIAARVKELREIADKSAEEVAATLGVAPETYRRYEEGTEDIPVSFLCEVASLFKVELGTILTGEDPRLRVYTVVRAGKGLEVERRSEYRYRSLAHNFVHKKAEPFLVTVEAEPEDRPWHLNTHPGQEFNHVLEGSMKVVVAGHEVVLNQGDSLYFDSGRPHAMKALGGRPATFLAVIL